MKLIKLLIAVFLFAVALQVLSKDAFSQTTSKHTLTLAGAEQIIASAKAEAKKINAPGGVIAVVDDGGNLMALERLDGTFAAGANISIGKAGRNRWFGVRPTNRGVSMNPIDHAHGGGEGKSSGGGHPRTPWGVPTKGYKTRNNKRTDAFIVKRRK